MITLLVSFVYTFDSLFYESICIYMNFQKNRMVNSMKFFPEKVAFDFFSVNLSKELERHCLNLRNLKMEWGVISSILLPLVIILFRL